MELKIPFSKPDIGEAEKDAVKCVMDSGWVTMGPETKLFEDELAKYLGCRHVVVMNNGTSALFAALLSRNPKHVIIPAYNYPVITNITNITKWTVGYSDINEKTCLMESPPSTQIAVPVSFAGLPLDVEEWDPSLYSIIEDAAEAFGTESRGVKTGNQGWTSTFSFHVAKLITMVEGGAVATNDDEVADKVREIRSRRNLNFQPTDIGSAIGRVQLRKVEGYLQNREMIAKYYREALGGLVEFQEIPDYVTTHGNMMFPIFIEEPVKLTSGLEKLGIETRLGWKPLVETPASLQVSNHIICLPIFNLMEIKEAEYVVECVKKCL